MIKFSDSLRSLNLAASLLSLVLIIALLYVLQGVLIPLLFSILLAISLFPITRFFEKFKLNRVTASLLSVLIAIVLIGTLVWFIVHQVIVIGANGDDLQVRFMHILETIQKWFTRRFGIEEGEITKQITGFSNRVVSNAGVIVSTAFGSVGGILAGVVVVPLFTFFLLYYRDFFREFFFLAFASASKELVSDVLNKIYYVVQSYLVGLVTVMGIVAVLNTVGLLVLGIPYAWFFGILASLLMLLPYIGIAIGSILPALFALATRDSAWYAVGVVAWFQVVQFLEGNFLTPNIVGGKVSINPLMALIGLLLGGMLFGLAGLILAIPITAVLKVVFDAVPSMKAYGFLIGEPEKYHLKRFSGKIIMKRWKINQAPTNQE
ncbi:AI-2E family transporter [Dyadobacter chenwenxiniae]|uniref:AI-2E family transporter n=1 Tax=Dyadobacter chenwenxiniae TaxID=2906456 RepID=A0A9X1PPY1_9BACT|nr:AI-2E family transporter [Dyadobacter chenwenxiniae]MCF0065250.1 AI-2E family transporter [Dyadobacter chenwenxiniae]UON84480.1 AI-2E family transporter [Dyadobacter chenwenxiniae]